MSEAEKRLQDLSARRAESHEDRQARLNQERDEAAAYFEQTIVPGIETAVNYVNQQAATNSSTHEPPSHADVRQGPHAHDATAVELTVRRGLNAEIWFRGMMTTRTSPSEWTYRRNPRIKNDGTTTRKGTDRALKRSVSMAEWTSTHVSDDLLTRYADVVEARDKRRR